MENQNKDENENKYFKDEDYLDRISTVSSSDCTGLIRSGGNETEDAPAYNELYQYGIPHGAAKKAGLSPESGKENVSDILSSKMPKNKLD